MIAFFAILAILGAAQAQCPSGGQFVSNTCWYIASFPQSCDTFCPSVNGVSDSNAIINFAGAGAADNSGCQAVVNAFGIQAIVQDVSGADCDNQGLGCFFNVAQSLRCTSPATTTSATTNNFFGGGRFCACDIASSSGFTDPHFSGFNGESLDIKHDKEASNNYFNVFCRENVAINALFSPNPEELLYMTEFYAKFGDFEFVIDLKAHYPAGKYTIVSQSEEHTKYEIADGSVDIHDENIVVKYREFTYDFKSATMGSDRFLDMYVEGPRNNQFASGIVGRTLVRAYSPEEFSQYSHFMRQSPEDYTCSN